MNCKHLYLVVQRHVTGTGHYLSAPGFHTKWVLDTSVAAKFSTEEAAIAARDREEKNEPETHSGCDEYVVEKLWTDESANA